MNRLLHIAILCSLALSCFAQSTFDSTGRIYSKLFGFQLEKTTIDEVQNALGKTNVFESGDASAYSKRIHYFIKLSNCYVTFESGEMGGGIVITSFTVSIDPPTEQYATNSAVTISERDMGGIKLGISEQSFKQMFEGKNNISQEIVFANKLPMTNEQKRYFKIDEKTTEYFDETISISPTFIKSKLVRVEIYKVTSY